MKRTAGATLIALAACSGATVRATSAERSSGEALPPAWDAGPGGAGEADASPAVPDAATEGDASVAAATLHFVIVPMHLLPAAGATGGDARVDLELTADGTLRSHGAYVGQFVGDRVLARDGRELVVIAPDGLVSLRGSATQIRFDADGSVAMPNGGHLTFTDDGRPLVISPQGQRNVGPMQLVGFRSEARATASLLGLLVATTSLANSAPPAQ